MTLQELKSLLEEVGIPVAHYETLLTEFPYIIYRELNSSYNHASGRAWREVTNVSVDHFTKKEWDTTLDQLKLLLLQNKINFTTVTLFYEEDKVIHTQFDFAIAQVIDMEV
jgi:hypothetical protein